MPSCHLRDALLTRSPPRQSRRLPSHFFPAAERTAYVKSAAGSRRVWLAGQTPPEERKKTSPSASHVR